MELIDTHAHLYDKTYDADRADMLQRAKESGVTLILIPNVDIDTIAPMIQLERESEGYCKPMIGIHPCSIDSDYKSQLDVAMKWLEKNPTLFHLCQKKDVFPTTSSQHLIVFYNLNQ